MKKSFLPIILATLVCLPALGCAIQTQDNIPIYSDPVEEIMVQEGEEFAIVLDYDPDAGYTWYEEYDMDKLQLVESICAFCRVGAEDFFERQGYSAPNIPTAGQYSRFMALGEGKTTITMAYKDSADSQAVEERIYKVTIE